MMVQKSYGLRIVEFERGYGQRILDELYFNNREERDQYVEDYNQDMNYGGFAPECYIIAQAI